MFDGLISSLNQVFEFAEKNLTLAMQIGQVHIITTLLHIFESVTSTKDDDEQLLWNLIFFSTIWAFGGFLDDDKERPFDQVVDIESYLSLKSNICCRVLCVVGLSHFFWNSVWSRRITVLQETLQLCPELLRSNRRF
jgi:hypothetical protein